MIDKPTSSMPFGDWQFWVVTIIALVALFFAIRALTPRRKKRTQSPASLTIEGDSPRKHRRRKS